MGIHSRDHKANFIDTERRKLTRVQRGIDVYAMKKKSAGGSYFSATFTTFVYFALYIPEMLTVFQTICWFCQFPRVTYENIRYLSKNWP